MTTYKITIKDNSIPEHMQKACPCFKPIHEDIIESNNSIFNVYYVNDDIQLHLNYEIKEYIQALAQELDTDPESLEILSIIKQNKHMKIIDQQNIGKSKYIISWHDGSKYHADGSPFYDIKIFKNKLVKELFIIALNKKLNLCKK